MKETDEHRTSNVQLRTPNIDGAALCLLNKTKGSRIESFMADKCRWDVSPCWVLFNRQNSLFDVGPSMFDVYKIKPATFQVGGRTEF